MTLKNIKVLYESLLLDYLMIILQLYLRLNTKQYGKGLKILTPKQMLRRLPIAFAQVKVGSKSKNLLNEIRQIIYSLY